MSKGKLKNTFIAFCGAAAIGFYSCSTMNQKPESKPEKNYSQDNLSQRQREITLINRINADTSFMWSRIRLLDEAERGIAKDNLYSIDSIIREFRKTEEYKGAVNELRIEYNKKSMHNIDSKFSLLLHNFLNPKILTAKAKLKKELLEYELADIEEKNRRLNLSDIEKKTADEILYGTISAGFNGDLKHIPGFFEYFESFSRQQHKNGVFEKQYKLEELDVFSLGNFLMNNHLPTNFREFYNFFMTDKYNVMNNTISLVWLTIGGMQKRIMIDKIPKNEEDEITNFLHNILKGDIEKRKEIEVNGKKMILETNEYFNDKIINLRVDDYIFNSDIFDYISKKITKDIYMSKIKKEIK